MSKEERQERARLRELGVMLEVAKRTLMVVFNDRAALDEALAPIRNMQAVEGANWGFDSTAIVRAREREGIDGLVQDLRRQHPEIAGIRKFGDLLHS